MAWGSGGWGSVPFGSTVVEVDLLNLAGTGATEFGGSGTLETGAAPDPSVTPFEFSRRTKPIEMLRRTKPLEMLRR